MLEFLVQLAKISVLCGLLGLITLLVRRIAPRAGVFWRAAIWALLLIRLAVPINFITPIGIEVQASPIEVVGWEGYEDPNLANNDADNRATDKANSPGENNNAEGSRKKAWGIYIGDILSALWIAGAGIVFLWFIYIQVRFNKQLGKLILCDDIRINGILKECCAELRVKGRACWCDIHGSALAGLLRPRILVPPNAVNWSDEQLRYALLHELMHQKRRDLWFLWFILFIKAVHWFNPLIWIIAPAIREDLELCCDSSLLSRLTEKQRLSYGMTLVDMQRPVMTRAVSSSFSSRKGLKSRVKMIAAYSNKKAWLGGLLALVLTLSCIACTTQRPQINKAQSIPMQNAISVSPGQGNENGNADYLEALQALINETGIEGYSQTPLISGGIEFMGDGVNTYEIQVTAPAAALGVSLNEKAQSGYNGSFEYRLEADTADADLGAPIYFEAYTVDSLKYSESGTPQIPHPESQYYQLTDPKPLKKDVFDWSEVVVNHISALYMHYALGGGSQAEGDVSPFKTIYRFYTLILNDGTAICIRIGKAVVNDNGTIQRLYSDDTALAILKGLALDGLFTDGLEDRNMRTARSALELLRRTLSDEKQKEYGLDFTGQIRDYYGVTKEGGSFQGEMLISKSFQSTTGAKTDLDRYILLPIGNHPNLAMWEVYIDNITGAITRCTGYTVDLLTSPYQDSGDRFTSGSNLGYTIGAGGYTQVNPDNEKENEDHYTHEATEPEESKAPVLTVVRPELTEDPDWKDMIKDDEEFISYLVEYFVANGMPVREITLAHYASADNRKALGGEYTVILEDGTVYQFRILYAYFDEETGRWILNISPEDAGEWIRSVIFSS